MRKNAEAEVLDYQRKMEDMQLNFSHMLKDTLDKVNFAGSVLASTVHVQYWMYSSDTGTLSKATVLYHSDACYAQAA